MINVEKIIMGVISWEIYIIIFRHYVFQKKKKSFVYNPSLLLLTMIPIPNFLNQDKKHNLLWLPYNFEQN